MEKEQKIDRLADFQAEQEMQSDPFQFIKDKYIENYNHYSENEIDELLKEFLD